jgi:hypothetical protein
MFFYQNVQIYVYFGSVQMHSGRHVLNFYFQPLGLKSDRKEGGILGTEIYNFNLYIFTK